MMFVLIFEDKYLFAKNQVELENLISNIDSKVIIKGFNNVFELINFLTTELNELSTFVKFENNLLNEQKLTLIDNYYDLLLDFEKTQNNDLEIEILKNKIKDISEKNKDLEAIIIKNNFEIINYKKMINA